jgi:hypothetical protein
VSLFTISEIVVDFTVSVIMLRSSRSTVEGVFMRRLESGDRERHLRAGVYAILLTGGLGTHPPGTQSSWCGPSAD